MYFGHSSGETWTSSTESAGVPAFASASALRAFTFRSYRSRRSPSASFAASAFPSTSSFRAGRFPSAVARASSRFVAPASSVEEPGAKSTKESSCPPPKRLPRRAKGDRIAFRRTFPTIFQTIGPTRNFGSSTEPEIGTSSRITPSGSFRSETASFTGSFVAVGLSTFSPNVNWSTTNEFCASSRRSFSLYATFIVSSPFSTA